MIPIWPPIAGTYAMTLTRGGVLVPVRIWFGGAVIDGEPQDRSHDWRVEIDGRADMLERGDDGYSCRVAIPVDRAWPFCAKRPISEGDYRYMLDKGKWAKEWAPHRPEADPHKKIDVRGPSVF